MTLHLLRPLEYYIYYRIGSNILVLSSIPESSSQSAAKDLYLHYFLFWSITMSFRWVLQLMPLVDFRPMPTFHFVFLNVSDEISLIWSTTLVVNVVIFNSNKKSSKSYPNDVIWLLRVLEVDWSWLLNVDETLLIWLTTLQKWFNIIE
jgi:hypothetical protein